MRYFAIKMKVRFQISANNLSGMKVHVMHIVFFVFGLLTVKAQNETQNLLNQIDTVAVFDSDSTDCWLIRHHLTNVCPIEMVEIPEKVLQILTTRSPDTGEMTMTISTLHGFKLSKCEITQIQWETVMGTNPSCKKGNWLPVENVSYNDIQAFINKINRVMGTKYYLPTENQWQHAAGDCRTDSFDCYAGTKDKNELHKYVWYINNSSGQTHQVGTRLPNARGLYDMNGNVREWCLLSELSEEKQFTNVNLPDSIQVITGGSWASEADGCMLSKRKIYSANLKSNDLGFRLALEP
jgi:formylglycine-generating enzyme required for sulfatase activity